jgi:hypothetical protein
MILKESSFLGRAENGKKNGDEQNQGYNRQRKPNMYFIKSAA